ncbi:MAG TPA: flagellar assembly protein FliW [Solirubrobacteraceae bacterium]|nr:flagellar assembly protein FliW [Solirubrobacteraceae bacterium]
MSTLAPMIPTTRFGELEVRPEDLLHFPDGLIGLGGNEYLLVSARQEPFVWLQSLADPAVALVLCEPGRFFPDFALEISDSEGQRLGLEPDTLTQVFVTVRAAPRATECTANLRAPIVVLGTPGGVPRRAHQVINQASGVALRAPLFGARAGG